MDVQTRTAGGNEMNRMLTACIVLFVSSSLFAAPVPKKVRARPGHVGKWQNVNVDPKNPAMILSRGQFWYLGDDGSFTYQNQDEQGPPPPKPERLVFEPKTGHVQHSEIAPDEKIRLGCYKIEGDRITMNLNSGPGLPRPTGLEPGANCNIWHLQRMEEKK